MQPHTADRGGEPVDDPPETPADLIALIRSKSLAIDLAIVERIDRATNVMAEFLLDLQDGLIQDRVRHKKRTSECCYLSACILG